MLSIAFCIAFIVQFINVCTLEGMVLSPIAEKLYGLPVWLKKPLFNCPICMTPWWGALLLFLGTVFSSHKIPFLECIAVVFIAGGINTVFVKITTYEAD